MQFLAMYCKITNVFALLFNMQMQKLTSSGIEIGMQKTILNGIAAKSNEQE